MAAPARVSADEADFLPGVASLTEAPPRMLVLALPATVMALTCAGLIYAALGRVDIVSIAEGRLSPVGGVQLVQPADAGVVRAIHVRDGQKVTAGQVLLELDPTDSAADLTRLDRQIQRAAFDYARAEALIAQLDDPQRFWSPPAAAPDQLAREYEALIADAQQLRAQRRAAKLEAARAEAARDQIASKVAKLEAVRPLIQKRYEAREALTKQQIASETALLELRQSLVETTADLEVERKALKSAEADLALARSRADQVEEDQRRKLLADSAAADRDRSAAESERRKAQGRLERQKLTAPMDGVAQDLAVVTLGGVVRQGDVLLRVAPDHRQLELEARIQNRDIGFVQAGQRVDVKLESFPFTIYGAVPGRVVDVARDAGDEAKGLSYKARVALERDFVLVHDRKVDLSPGMKATLDIHAGDRSILDYLLSPVFRAQNEALRER